MPIDYAGNTLGTARGLNITPTTQTFTDWVGSLDTNDYYRFSLSSRSSFNLSLTGMSADADVQLLNSSGVAIGSSARASNLAESINSTLDSGTYYIRVYPFSGSTNYNLNVSATAIAMPDYAGNSMATARNISLTANTATYRDWVGSVDTNDYYRFTLNSASNFNLSLNGMSADADVQLLNGSGSVIQSSTAGGATSESIVRSLSAGTYYIRVYPFSGSTNYNLNVSATQISPSPSPSPDWFSQNLRDFGIISTTRSLGADGNLSRNDMIAIFRNAGDSSVVDATELIDLRTIVSNASRFTMQDHVRVLSNNVVNGNVANRSYQGSTLGNLYAGSSATQMENLINKWFFGGDRPQTTSSAYTYRYASGSLFQNGISANDVRQGAVGDCYYLATLSSAAHERPSYIQNMFIDNGDGTFTVRFFNNGTANYVTVDRYLPTNSVGSFAYASAGSAYNSSSNELWVALAEKAYAQMAESGWTRGANATNSYQAISGGWMAPVMQQITGTTASSQSVSSMTQQQLIDLVNSNCLLAAGFVYGGGYGVVNSHAYTITSYNSSTGRFHLRNPWGIQDADVSWQELLNLRAIVQWSNA